MTTKYQRGKQHLEEVATEADAKADELVEQGETILAKLKKSKYTAAGILGAGLLAAFLLTR
jgi:hypothetical protein